MGGNLSAGYSVHHLGCDTAALPGSPFPYYRLSLECVWELATTRGGLAVILSLSLILVVRYSTSPWRRVPPGPRGLPLIGNVLELKDKVWMFRRDCKQKYEDVMYLSALGQPILVLNSLKAASELLDRRGTIYSGRPRLIMAHEIISGGLIFAFLNHSLAAVAGGQLIRALQSWQFAVITTSYVKKEYFLLTALLANPAFADRMSSAVAPGTYLGRVVPLDVTHPRKVRPNIDALFPAAQWYNLISGSLGGSTEGSRDFTQFNALFESLFDRVLSALSEGSERPSMSASIFKGSDQNQLSHQEMSWLSGTLFIAGTETASTTMNWWALAMVMHPEVQQRAHIELDTVVGRSRAPTFSDAPNLPYIQAIVKEVLRWRPALPFSLPHSTMEDDWYNGMFIPKGTICLTNLLQCNRDSYYGDDAADFRPERFLDVHGEILPGPAETREDGHGSYGFGKRACVGKHIANESLFIYIATALWAVTLERAHDEDGNEVPVSVYVFVDTGTTIKPAPYECEITPRFDEVVSILAAEEELLKA
ncbi:cytochrome P450 [Lactarius indigo]|nr:cytochrome P450 [Lactarius indigo]